MRVCITSMALMCAALLFMTNTNRAGEKDKKDVVLKGRVACNKCELAKSAECETVIVVKDAKTKKDIVYIFDKASHEKFHDDICSGGKNGSVTGVVSDAGTKKMVSVKKVDYEKE